MSWTPNKVHNMEAELYLVWNWQFFNKFHEVVKLQVQMLIWQLSVLGIPFFPFFKILNLCQAFRKGHSPVQLVQMPLVTMEKNRKDGHPGRVRQHSDSFTQSFNSTHPFFSWCWPRFPPWKTISNNQSPKTPGCLPLVLRIRKPWGFLGP